jgi:alpha-beta hydrolase superfamily lysophospholipase
MISVLTFIRRRVAVHVFLAALVMALAWVHAASANVSPWYNVRYKTQSLIITDTYLPTGPAQFRLNYREWFVPDASEVLVYLSGMQSHSQWFNEAGDYLASLGYNVYALDRRGSGLSAGMRGHTYSPFEWIADLYNMIEFARAKNPGKKIHLMANSFGARIAMTFAVAFPHNIDSLILESPATNMQVSLDSGVMVEVQRRNREYFPTPLHDELFTHDPAKLAFIAQDKLGLGGITANVYKFGDLLNTGNLMPQSMARLSMPVLVLVSLDDKIIDPPAVISGVYDRLTKKLLTYTGVDHFLLFTDKHIEVLDAIDQWIDSVHAPVTMAKANAPAQGLVVPEESNAIGQRGLTIVRRV